MDGLISFGNKRSYDDFKKQIPKTVQPLFDLLREYCFSLGNNVIEDVRMHRVVFCKSITFRWFADFEPQNEGILIKIQRDRKESQKHVQISIESDLDEIKQILDDAYKNIH